MASVNLCPQKVPMSIQTHPPCIKDRTLLEHLLSNDKSIASKPMIIDGTLQ